jgi:hypothetical protein
MFVKNINIMFIGATIIYLEEKENENRRKEYFGKVRME